LQATAEIVHKDHNEAKADTMMSMKKRRALYSMGSLLPEDILELIPYQNTLEAIEDQSEEWEENLKKHLCNYVCVMTNKIYQFSWDQMETKEDKRRVVKQLVYLDALITLYRMPNQFSASLSDLVERFRQLPEDPLLAILEKFCKITIDDPSGKGAKRRNVVRHDNQNGTRFSFLKSKEDMKTLILNIIGLVVHMSTQ
jgi:hypothetical protein